MNSRCRFVGGVLGTGVATVTWETTMLRILAAAIGGVLLLAQAEFPVFAQSWPTRPLRLVVPFSAGGSTDQTARVLAEGLRPLLGQTLLVDNRPGAGGNIAAELVANATPDRYCE